MIEWCRHRIALLAGGILLLGGCASAGLSPLHYTTSHLENHDRQAVFDAAKLALIDSGFQIHQADYAKGILKAKPLLESRGNASSRSSAWLSSPEQQRRVAEVRVEQQADVVSIYCKITIERQVTAAHRMFAYNRSSSDLPDTTPIEREAGTTTEQNTVWETIRRDRSAEHTIVKSIETRLGG